MSWLVGLILGIAAILTFGVCVFVACLIGKEESETKYDRVG